MKLLVERLIANEHGGPLAALNTLSDTPIDQQIVGNIVVHAATVLLSRNKADILLPFHHMLHDPSALAVRDILWECLDNLSNFMLFLYYPQKAYLPTMPEGIQRENLIAISKSGEYYGNLVACYCIFSNKWYNYFKFDSSVECLNGHPILVTEVSIKYYHRIGVFVD